MYTKMKKYLFLVIAVVFSFTSGYAFDKYSIDRNDLPEAAQTFLTEYFPKAKVGMVKTDKHLLKKTGQWYENRIQQLRKMDFRRL